MKEKILRQFDKEFNVIEETSKEHYLPDNDAIKVKNFISQALDEYADWKIKECLPEKRYVPEVCLITGCSWNDCIDYILNKDKK